MKKIILFACIVTISLATKLIDLNTYSSKNHVDIIISTDKPYNGETSYLKKNLHQYILFKNLSTSSNKEVAKEHRYYKYIRLYAQGNDTLMEIRLKKDMLYFNTSLSKDKYSVRVRITHEKPVLKRPKQQAQDNPLSQISDLEQKYLISFAFVGLFLLLWILAKLFDSSKIKEEPNPFEVKMSVEKRIDNRNKIVKIRFAKMNYIILMGQTNILIDKFPDHLIAEKKSFGDLIKKDKKNI